MRVMSNAEQRYYVSLRKINDALEKENQTLRAQNQMFKEQVRKLECMVQRVKELECEYTDGIRRANEIVLSCKRALAESRQLDQGYRIRVSELTGGMVS